MRVGTAVRAGGGAGIRTGRYWGDGNARGGGVARRFGGGDFGAGAAGAAGAVGNIDLDRAQDSSRGRIERRGKGSGTNRARRGSGGATREFPPATRETASAFHEVAASLRECATGVREAPPGDREGAPADHEMAPGDREGAPADHEMARGDRDMAAPFREIAPAFRVIFGLDRRASRIVRRMSDVAIDRFPFALRVRPGTIKGVTAQLSHRRPRLDQQWACSARSDDAHGFSGHLQRLDGSTSRPRS